MLIFNQSSFPDTSQRLKVRGAARGYGESGERSGGLKETAREVILPAGVSILRVHDGSSPFGQWWFTPWEYCRIADYFGISGEAMMRDRSKGRSALHAALALLSEWYRDRSDQICRYTLLQLREPFAAYYGEGDVAIRKGSDGLQTAVPAALLDGQKPARQLFLPDLGFYRDGFTEIVSCGMTDFTLHALATGLGKARLSFE